MYINETATRIEISKLIFFESVLTKEAIFPSPSGSIIPAISFKANIKITSSKIGERIVPAKSNNPADAYFNSRKTGAK